MVKAVVVALDAVLGGVVVLCVNRQSDGQWYTFTGNEIGTLLGCWQWSENRWLHPDMPASKVAMVSSCVSSKMLKVVGEAEGFIFEETLTGFKWIGNKVKELEKAGITVVFSYEEAIGYCVGPSLVPDKDGVSAAAVFAEMATCWGKQGLRVKDQLDRLHQQYGELVSKNHYYFCDQPAVVAAIFERLRHGGSYWEECGGFKIVSVRDLTWPGYDSSTQDKKPTLPVSSSTQMLTYSFLNGVVLTLRTSGTEPKIKYYSELAGRPGVPKDQVRSILEAFLKVVLPLLLEPDKHGLRGS